MGRKWMTRPKPQRKMQKMKPGAPEVHNHEPLPPGCAMYLFRSWAMLTGTCLEHAAGISPALPTLHSNQICVVLNQKWSGHCKPGTRDKPVGFAVSCSILNWALNSCSSKGTWSTSRILFLSSVDLSLAVTQHLGQRLAFPGMGMSSTKLSELISLITNINVQNTEKKKFTSFLESKGLIVVYTIGITWLQFNFCFTHLHFRVKRSCWWHWQSFSCSYLFDLKQRSSETDTDTLKIWAVSLAHTKMCVNDDSKSCMPAEHWLMVVFQNIT